MDSLFHLLYKIRKNPALYFGGRENLALLRAFIDGYIARQRETDGNFRGTFALNGFQEFVQDRYEIVSVHSWDKIIDFYSSNDREAFETFFKLLDEFHHKRRDGSPQAEGRFSAEGQAEGQDYG